MVNWKRFVGYSAYMGNKRRLDELLGKKHEFENAVKLKQRDWEVCQDALPEINAQIAELEIKVAKEDAQ